MSEKLLNIVPQNNYQLTSVTNLAALDFAIEQATTFAGTVDIQKRIDVLLDMARIADCALEQQNEIALRRLLAIRRGGQILEGLERDKNQWSAPDRLSGAKSEYREAITESSVSERTARRWQTVGRIPEETFNEYIDETIEKKSELTFAGVLRHARRAQPTDSIPLPEGTFRIIYADPPWYYGNTMGPYMTNISDHYPQMTTDEICALNVGGIAQDNAVLFMWTTSPHLQESFRVIEAWGFEYKASFVWDKVKHNMGHYNSVRHELLLVSTRGACQPDTKKLFDSVVSIERSEHSEKPEEFRNIIDTLYPHGDRVELFARKQVAGWASYGNQL